MDRELKALSERARTVQMTPKEQEKQRRSFAYGNTKIENDRITRETIDREADSLAVEHGTKDSGRARKQAASY